MARLKALFILLGLTVYTLFGQRPREIQLDEEPFDFTDPFKLIFIVIIPLVLLIVGTLIIRKKQRKK
ncbi:MAG: hypothetical protein R3279_04190 [Putridiphycobacter sp.]|nr:hypothetical protein [Putridiphycobacter sp.]